MALLSEDRLYKSILEEGSSPLVHSEKNTQLQLQIELENGEKVYISPQPTDEPLRLATQFCQRHNLDSDMIDVLTDSIQTSMIRSQHSYGKTQHEPLTIDDGSKGEKDVQQEQGFRSCEYDRGQVSSNYKNKKGSLNFGSSLYQKSMIREEEHKNWINRQKQRKVREQLRECTHKPDINSLSRCIVKSLRGLGQVDSESDPINKLKDIQMGVSVSLNSCTIKDDGVSMTKSKQSHGDKRLIKSSSSIFERLYENNKKAEPKKAAINKNEHRPSINQISKQIVGNTKFSDRMVRYQHQRQLKMAKCSQAEKENLYTPKIGLPPPNRNVEALPIGDYLYNRRKIAINHEVPPLQTSNVNATSNLIYDYRKEQCFSRLFRHIDIEKRGRIGWSDCINGCLDEQIKSIARPLLQEWKMMGEELTEEEFKKAFNLLFGTLDPASRNVVLHFKAKKTQNACDDNSFRPEINSNSQKIVRSMNRARMSIYEYCSIKQAARAQTLECERVAKQKYSLQECTFHPNIEKPVLYF